MGYWDEDIWRYIWRYMTWKTRGHHQTRGDNWFNPAIDSDQNLWCSAGIGPPCLCSQGAWRIQCDTSTAQQAMLNWLVVYLPLWKKYEGQLGWSIIPNACHQPVNSSARCPDDDAEFINQVAPSSAWSTLRRRTMSRSSSSPAHFRFIDMLPFSAFVSRYDLDGCVWKRA